MARLPTVGGDAGNWGEVLNDYLVQSHAADGLLKTDSVGAPQLKPSSVTSAALAPGAVTSAKIDKLGQAGGVATLDGSGKLPEGNLPDRLSTTTLATTYVTKPASIADGQVPVWNAAQTTFVAGATGSAGAGVTFVTLTSASQAVTIPTGNVAGLALVQDNTGGRTAAWPTGIRWDGGTTPTLSAAAGATDVFTFIAVTGGGWLGKKDGSHPAPADTTPPSAVTNLVAGTTTTTSVPLTWTAATDNVAVTGYEYSTNGTTWTSTNSTGTSYTVTGLTANTSYTIQVRAFDAAGNKGTAASVTATTAAATATWVSITSDTFTAPDGTPLSGRTMDTGGVSWGTQDAALTIQANRVDWGLKDVAGMVGPTITTGSTRHRISFTYDISRQKNGNEQNLTALVWLGGTRSDGSNRSTAHQVKIAKPLYNSATATLSGTTPYSEALTITAQNGKDLTAVPLTGKLTAETQADDATINVLIDDVLWATVSRLAPMTMGTQAYVTMFGAYATMDNLLIEAYK